MIPRSAVRSLSASTLFIAVVLLTSCRPGPNAGTADGKISVFVTVDPLRYLAEAVGGDRVIVRTLVGNGADPHTFEPSSSAMVNLSSADLYFAVGVAFEEAFMDTITANLPDLTVVETAAGADILDFVDDHGDEKSEDHEGPDPHIWMGPAHALKLAEAMRAALAAFSPADADYFASNYESLRESVAVLEDEIRTVLEPVSGGVLLVAHPAFGYFTQEFGLTQTAVEVDGKEPTPRQLENLVAEAREEGVDTIIVQPQFPESSARLLAEAIDGTVVEIDHLSYEWPETLKKLAAAAAEGIR